MLWVLVPLRSVPTCGGFDVSINSNMHACVNLRMRVHFKSSTECYSVCGFMCMFVCTFVCKLDRMSTCVYLCMCMYVYFCVRVHA